ncbi:MAG: Coq4 family protein [Spongiibacteraceae bacterium]
MTEKKEVYQFSHKPKNIFRTLLATWRVLKDPNDLEANVAEAALVEMYFNRSKFGRKIAKWELLAQEVRAKEPLAAEAMDRKRRLGYVHIDKLAQCPSGSFGHTVATLAKVRGIDPNLVEPMPHPTDGDWLMAHIYETHDFWHVLTGHYFDMEGEYGVVGFYMAQVQNFAFFAFFMSIINLQHVWGKREEISKMTDAFCKGYEMGKQANCLVGLDWESLYDRDLQELREELNIHEAGKMPSLALVA